MGLEPSAGAGGLKVLALSLKGRWATLRPPTMSLTIPTCPHCGAPLVTSRFAATVACSFCGATVRVDPTVVSAERYREARKAWNHPAPKDGDRRFSIGDTHWTVEGLLAHGEISDVYLARRARWPSELVLFKVLRSPDDATLLEHEWRVLEGLHETTAAGEMNFGARVPLPVTHGELDGAEAGRRGAAYRWAPGFLHTFEAVRAVYPDGISPVCSIWVWRRILETLAVLTRAGLAHGAVLPNHLLIQTGEHGVRLIGFSCADVSGAALRVVCTRFEDFYPAALRDGGRVSAQADMAMSARCISYLLGGSGRGEVPGHVPAPLADVILRTAHEGNERQAEPWELRQQLGDMAKTIFGPPAFHPIVMD